MTTREDYIKGQPLDDLYRNIAAALAEWVGHPCPEHLFKVGVSVGSVAGYPPSFTLEAGIEVLREQLGRNATIDMTLRPEIDLLQLNELGARLFVEP